MNCQDETSAPAASPCNTPMMGVVAGRAARGVDERRGVDFLGLFREVAREDFAGEQLGEAWPAAFACAGRDPPDESRQPADFAPLREREPELRSSSLPGDAVAFLTAIWGSCEGHVAKSSSLESTK
eukprot:scaffold177799_cov30-Tisochrysis_lutea.AAC.1